MNECQRDLLLFTLAVMPVAVLPGGWGGGGPKCEFLGNASCFSIKSRTIRGPAGLKLACSGGTGGGPASSFILAIISDEKLKTGYPQAWLFSGINSSSSQRISVSLLPGLCCTSCFSSLVTCTFFNTTCS